MAEMIQVQIDGSLRLKRGSWYRVETFVREQENGTREFLSTVVVEEPRLLDLFPAPCDPLDCGDGDGDD